MSAPRKGRRATDAGRRIPAENLPIAQVCTELGLAHLDRTFDYQVPSDLADSTVPGVRVRVRLAGRLVDGYVLARAETTEHEGRLGWLERVVSPEPVLAPTIVGLARAVADRCAGTMPDVLRLAVPPRHARVEGEAPRDPAPVPERPATSGWARYPRGAAFLDALAEGRPAHACWETMPGEDWPARLAEVATTAVAAGRGALLIVPDRRDVDELTAACTAVAGADAVVALTADLGPAERYRRWLAVRRGAVRLVVGTRAAAFAPVADLGLAVIWDDGDDLHVEPRAPYPHVRLVLGQRAVLEKAALLVAGRCRTAETQLAVESGWAHEITADRRLVREASPRVTAIGEDDAQLAKDPLARSARLPVVAFDATREALARDHAVLVQVPRRGYVPRLACADCRSPARCRRCAGPLGLPSPGVDPDTPRPPSCRWCAVVEPNYRCGTCGSRRLRSTVVGSGRTAEELGRAFPGTTVHTSSAGAVLAHAPAGPCLVVATPGAEPVGRYGAALLLDTWALLGRADLRAGEETLRRWMSVAGMVVPGSEGGRVVITADTTVAAVQALVRWDPAGFAAAELADRRSLGFPPVTRMAALEGLPDALAEFAEIARFPSDADVLGPVPVGDEGRERLLVRVARSESAALARSLLAAQAVRSAKKAPESVRVELDPHELG